MAVVRTRAWILVSAALLLAGCEAAGASPAGTLGNASSSVPTSAPSSTPALERVASSPPPTSAAPAVPDRTVEESGGFRLAVLRSASCTAEAPSEWTITAPDKSDRADVLSPDGSRYAGYGIQAVNTTLQGFASAYEPPFNDPSLYSDDPGTVAIAYGQIIVAGIGGSADLVVEEAFQPSADYLLLSVAGSTHRGGIFFRASGYPGDGYNYSYALPMYFAFSTHAQWDSQGLLTARVATSIRCVTQFQPPDDYFVVEAGDAGGADPNGGEAGYNPQLGTEYANDPDTGTNYLVDPSVNWSETGPDGPGYYVARGEGDYGKLEPGRID
jgi:hypothetical protein